uniref:Uncharacterized protein n=1 Tax=Anopheles culicifacies TaxID=139723 RepID=A0A182LSK8_9DIPT
MMAETVVTVETPNRNAGTPTATPAAGQAQAKPESNLNWLKFNTQYFITIPGILKIVQVVSNAQVSPSFRQYPSPTTPQKISDGAAESSATRTIRLDKKRAHRPEWERSGSRFFVASFR